MLYALGRKSSLKWTLWLVQSNFNKFYLSFLKQQVTYSSNFASVTILGNRFSWVNCNQKWINTVNFQYVSFLLKHKILKKVMQQCLSVMGDYSWTKFQQNGAIFGGQRAQNPFKIGDFMAAASPRNHLNIYNLGTTNAIKMKLIRNIYLYKTFDLV